MRRRATLSTIITVLRLLLLHPITVINSECPFLLKGSSGSDNVGLQKSSTPPSSQTLSSPFTSSMPDGFPPHDILKAYGIALNEVNWDDVRADLRKLYRSVRDDWPSDYGHYGGLFVRLAWHCSGSYRQSDGRGGCDGGNQRFEPERSWPDNTNLDKARGLLAHIKTKHGLGLSWGDLFILAGTEAIRDMGGPVLGFCAGRIDTVDNSQTRLLGPTLEQEEFAHCEIDGDCKAPLGQNTMGLIYVNPEGPFGKPDAQGAADTIRDVFGRMTMDDRENVALIGGGHTFGKTHGACEDGAGPSPGEDEDNPYPGKCGTGRGNDAFTSGFEGPWTANPTQWDNTFMKNLIEYRWEAHLGPGGHYQWRVKGGVGPRAPVPYPPGSNETQEIMMLTTDVGLVTDPEYRKYVQEFAADEGAFAKAFQEVWYKLTSRDMGPMTRCTGPNVPPAQSFQHPLPDPPAKLADMSEVEVALDSIITGVDAVDGGVTYRNEFIRLAWQCANTFRITDYLGGCNGARIRFSPGKDWKSNVGLDQTLQILDSIKIQFGNALSWSDLIVLAGNVGLKNVGVNSNLLPFCPGRTDAIDGKGWEALTFGNDEQPASISALLELNQRRGLVTKEFVALSWTFYYPSYNLSTQYLRNILLSPGCEDVISCGLKNHPELRVWTDYYVAAGDHIFTNDLAAAWTKIMNSDRFDGPTGNVCDMKPSIYGGKVELSIRANAPVTSVTITINNTAMFFFFIVAVTLLSARRTKIFGDLLCFLGAGKGDI